MTTGSITSILCHLRDSLGVLSTGGLDVSNKFRGILANFLSIKFAESHEHVELLSMNGRMIRPRFNWEKAE